MTALHALAAALLLLAGAEPASAHTVIQGLDGFPGGILHPFFVPAHVVSLFAVGLLIGQQRAAHRGWLLLTFAAALVGAIGLVVSAFAFNEADSVLLAAGGLAGLLVALAFPLALLLSGPLVAIAGLALELDSVPETISTDETLRALLGSALGAWLAVTLTVSATVPLRREWQRIGMRVVGSWMAASAILVLTLRFAR